VSELSEGHGDRNLVSKAPKAVAIVLAISFLAWVSVAGPGLRVINPFAVHESLTWYCSSNFGPGNAYQKCASTPDNILYRFYTVLNGVYTYTNTWNKVVYECLHEEGYIPPHGYTCPNAPTSVSFVVHPLDIVPGEMGPMTVTFYSSTGDLFLEWSIDGYWETLIIENIGGGGPSGSFIVFV
jgi:hypothetical protein